MICSYLRMPFASPGGQAPGEDAPEDAHSRYEQRRQELQVRLTAQRILSAHLKPAAAEVFWANIDLDLTEAHLHQLDLSVCRIRSVQFSRAEFAGYARFDGAEFAGDARFDGAEFAGYAGFYEAKFAGYAGFYKAKFTGAARFGEAKLAGDAKFDAAEFAGDAGFYEAKFAGGGVRRGEARRDRGVRRGGVRRGREVRLGQVRRARDVRRGGVRQESRVSWGTRGPELRSRHFAEGVDHPPRAARQPRGGSRLAVRGARRRFERAVHRSSG